MRIYKRERQIPTHLPADFPTTMFSPTVFILISLTPFYFGADAKNKACSKLYQYPIQALSPHCKDSPSVGALTPEIIAHYGYNFELHQAVTDDGYVLKIFRIPPDGNDTRKNKQPIVLNHGVFVDAGFWTLIGESSPAFVLADQGYDIWLVNQRDTRYSDQHLFLTRSEYKYWSYSQDDLATYDVPAVLYKVANVTGKAGSMIYLGHSRGSMIIFMWASEHPREAKRLLQGVVALSPIVYLDPNWLIKLGAVTAPFIYNAVATLRIGSLFYPVEFWVKNIHRFCTSLPYVCMLAIKATSGKTAQLEPEDFMAFLSHYPSPISIQSLYHNVQLLKSGKFQKYDYGKSENLKRYGQEEPPVFNLSNFDLPVHMFFGKHDSLINEKGVAKAFSEIGSTHKYVNTVPVGVEEEKWQFDHCDFFWSRHLEEFFYNDLLAAIDDIRSHSESTRINYTH